MNHRKMNFAQRILLELLWGMSWIFSILPYWFKYHVVQNLLYLLLYHLLKYRYQVVMGNLRNSFPEKSEAELKKIARKFYLTLAEVFVDTFNLAHMPSKKMRRILKVKDCDKQRLATKGQDWVAMTAHFGCWEYCSFWVAYAEEQELMAVYHPLHSEVVDALYLRMRNLQNVVTVSMHETVRYYLRHRVEGVDGRRLVLGLIADQNPPRRPDSHWLTFLNQDSIFFDGAEKLALKFNLPVYFVRMDRTRRGCYEMSFELIWDGKSEIEPNVITETYAHKLEQVIVECPELWMWSHRRWKHKREDDNY